MRKILGLVSLLFILCFVSSLGPGFSFADEQVTITTYYPAPYGIYREIRVNQIAVGALYRVSGLADGTLLVSGNVGIGTQTPAGKLDVSMGNNDHFYVNNDVNIGLELRSGTSAGRPYIDFSNDNAVDYDSRIMYGAPYGVAGGFELRGSDGSRNIAATFMSGGGGPAVIRTSEVWFCTSY